MIKKYKLILNKISIINENNSNKLLFNAIIKYKI